ncbi:MAG: hypothetical protein U0T11_09295, partial [Chitinophagaceae bacterium]
LKAFNSLTVGRESQFSLLSYQPVNLSTRNVCRCSLVVGRKSSDLKPATIPKNGNSDGTDLADIYG